MNHLVTGACGFVGSAIVRDLVNKGHKVIAIDVIEDAKINSISEFHKVDILDKEKLSQLFRGVDCVHHNAALVPLSKSGKKFYKTNVIGTKNIIELSLQNNNNCLFFSGGRMHFINCFVFFKFCVCLLKQKNLYSIMFILFLDFN